MPNKFTPFAIKCPQCEWEMLIRPQQQAFAESECPAQPCPSCGSEATRIEFLQEAEDWLQRLASHIGWPNQKTQV